MLKVCLSNPKRTANNIINEEWWEYVRIFNVNVHK